jgi:hypothetical protein
VTGHPPVGPDVTDMHSADGRTPFFGPVVLSVLVWCQSFVGARIRRGSCSGVIGGVGGGFTRAASRRRSVAPRTGC